MKRPLHNLRVVNGVMWADCKLCGGYHRVGISQDEIVATIESDGLKIERVVRFRAEPDDALDCVLKHPPLADPEE